MNVIETRLQSLAWDAVRAGPAYGPDDDRRKSGASSVSGSRGVRGNLSSRCQGRDPSGRTTRTKLPMRGTGADQPVVATKPG